MVDFKWIKSEARDVSIESSSDKIPKPDTNRSELILEALTLVVTGEDQVWRIIHPRTKVQKLLIKYTRSNINIKIHISSCFGISLQATSFIKVYCIIHTMNPQAEFDPTLCCWCGRSHNGNSIRCFLCHGMVGKSCCYSLKDDENADVIERQAAECNFVFVGDPCNVALNDGEQLHNTTS